MLNAAVTISSGLFTLVAILLIGFHWTLDGEGRVRTLLMRLPNDRRQSVREILVEIETRVGGYVRGLGILALTIGVLDYVIFLLLGIPAALALAILAGLFEVVPVIGLLPSVQSRPQSWRSLTTHRKSYGSSWRWHSYSFSRTTCSSHESCTRPWASILSSRCWQSSLLVLCLALPACCWPSQWPRSSKSLPNAHCCALKAQGWKCRSGVIE